jgi:hypothetical protein
MASGEDMPPRRPLRRLGKKLSTTALTWMFVGIWSCVTAGMLAFALVMTYTGQTSGAGAQSTCTASDLLLPGCAGQPRVPGH